MAKLRHIKSVNIHAGHNAPGKVACGAVGLIDESRENREVVKYVIKYLKAGGITVYDCTVDNAASVSKNLAGIVAKCEQHDVDVNVSIHFNAGANDKKGNGKTTGTEVLVYSTSGGVKVPVAKAIREKIKALGFKDRGTKINSSLYVLRKTSAPAVLVECCFVDDKDDVKIYNAKKMGKAIASALLDVLIEG